MAGPLTYTETVTGIVGSGKDALPQRSFGTVTFKDGATTICANIPIDVGATTYHPAVHPSPRTRRPASHTITATYSDGDGELHRARSARRRWSATCRPAARAATISIVGNPSSPTVNGTNGNDFIYAVGENYKINGAQGNDCVVIGNGNDTIIDRNTIDVIVAGNGTEHRSRRGNGNNRITLGDGSANKVTAGKVGTRSC